MRIKSFPANGWVSFKIALIYAIFSTCWIFLSDRILYFFLKDPEMMTKIQTVKGFLFILVSALIIFLLLNNEIKKYLRTEKELRDTEKKFQAIFNHRFQLTGLLDCNGRLLMINEVALNMVDSSSDDLVGRYFWEMPHWKHSKHLQSEIKDAVGKVKMGMPVQFETTHQDFMGDLKYIDLSLTPVHDEKGNLVHIVPEGKDITEARLSEKQLIESERNYREIYNSTTDAIIIHDEDSGRIIDVNDTMLEMYGYTRSEALELDIEDISSEDPQFKQEEALKKVKLAINDGPQLFEWQGISSLFFIFIRLVRSPSPLAISSMLFATLLIGLTTDLLIKKIIPRTNRRKTAYKNPKRVKMSFLREFMFSIAILLFTPSK